MRIDVLTTFPEMFTTQSPGALGVSIPGRAVAAGKAEIVATDIRGFANNKHKKTDDRPFGGGPGMVMMCQPVWDCVEYVEAQDSRKAYRILLTPQGEPLSQKLVEELASQERLLLIAGHYEGIDERVIEKLAPKEISIGDYVLSGGELGAMVIIDAVVRLLPGVLGDDDSNQQDSFSRVEVPVKSGKRGKVANLGSMDSQGAQRHGAEVGGDGGGGQGGAGGKDGSGEKNVEGKELRLLDCPHYTKPREWMGMSVPEVLLSGDHGKIQAWRLEQKLARTRMRRPDLLGM